MTRKDKIPERKLTELTDRRFMLRFDNDDGARASAGGFHRDDYYLIGVVFSGRYTLSVDFEDYHLSEGNAVVISPGQIHAPHADSCGKGFVLALAPELLSDNDLSAIKQLTFANKVVKLSDGDLLDTVGLYEMLRRRKDQSGEVEWALASAIKSIVIGCVRPESQTATNRYQRLAIRFQQLMERHISDIKSPAEYAGMLNVSAGYLNEAIKVATGQSVGTMIGRYVTMLAKRELCYTAKMVKEIAYDLGYEDYNYFSRLFRRYAGMSPGAFRGKYIG